MAISPTVAISPKHFVIASLLCLQSVLAQQCLNSNTVKHSDGSQQSLPRTTSNLNQANSGHNFNAPQHANMHQMNYQQPSNIQQASFIQQAGNVQPQWNLQLASSQQPINSISNSQQPQQQNQPSNMYSALQNVRPNHGTYMAQLNPSQQTSQSLSSTSSISGPIMNKPQHGNQPSTIESPQFHPTFTSCKTTQNNTPSSQNQQNNIPPSLNACANAQSIGQCNKNQPVSNSAINQRATSVQSPMIIVPGPQTNTAQSQPMVLTFQAPQILPVQSLSTGQIGLNQPIVYAVQTPSSLNQNQQAVRKQADGLNNFQVDDQSLMTYVMSQMQNQLGSDNVLASVLPAIINTKSEKSSLKSLLPLIFNMMTEKSNSCRCPHCGCNNNNQNFQEPVINSGYSNKKIYSSQEPINDSTKNSDSNYTKNIVSITDKENNKNLINDDNTDISEEEEEEEDDKDYSEEYYEDE